MSGGGRHVAFYSATDNMVPDDRNRVEDVFVRDRLTGITSRVSVDNAGREGNGASAGGVLNRDGRFVAFGSAASDLVGGDTNASVDVFVRDRTLGLTTRVSVASSGRQADGDSSGPMISRDGRYVAFSSTASDLVPDDTNDVADLFLHDRSTASTIRVNVAADGSQSSAPARLGGISDDGRYITFSTAAAGLVPDDADGVLDVFVRDTVDRETVRVSVDSSGRGGNGPSVAGSISGDGRTVVFQSVADNLVADDTNHAVDVFLHDRLEGTTERISLGPGDTQVSGYSTDPAITADGRHVTFLSEDLGDAVVWVRDLVNGTNEPASVPSNGGSGLGYRWFRPSLSDDARIVVFTSQLDSLTPGGACSPEFQTWVRDRAAPANPFGDFDADGLSDLITRRASTGSLLLHRGAGNGLVLDPVVVGGTGWNGMDSIGRLDDFDLDGREDVIARQKSTGELWLYPGRLTGLSPRLRLGIRWNGMDEVTPLRDFDGDGFPDVVAVEKASGNLYLYPGRGRSLAPRRLIGRGGWNGMDELTGVGDFTQDGRPDLIARARATGDLFLYPGRGSGFAARQRVGTGWTTMRQLAGIGDFNRDGYTDLAATRSTNGQLLLLPWRGRAFGPSQILRTGWTSTHDATL